jgi:hypothetical protein
MRELTQERLQERLLYDENTGEFTWRTPLTKRMKVGQLAGAVKRGGYIRIGLDGKTYAAHRLAWLYKFGRHPGSDLDHINRVKTDNRIANLREVSRAQNNQNAGVTKSNSSGSKGVTRHKTGKWQAQIRAFGKNHYLGIFSDISDAHAAYCLAASRLHTHNPSANGDPAEPLGGCA